jgi:serine/threonine-protein kinase
MVLVRAALIPSSPRRTILSTAMIGIPVILTPTLLVPAPASGGFSIRALDSGAYPWFPAALVIVWCIVVMTSTVTSRVIYGLRAEVRNARRLGQYVLERKIGEGGMGEVYRARHGMMRRPTALKLLRSDHGDRGLARFEQEVRLTARLTHPNTITLFDYGRTDDGIFYYAMELLDGANLQRIVQVTGAQPEARVVKILMMACGALAEAHAIGLVHRDVKPANIMLCSRGGERDVVKVLDFGLVKELAVGGDAQLSVASNLIGTPHYMAPESITAPDTVTALVDIYGLGGVAYFLLAGSEVFRGGSLVEVCSQHLYEVPEPLSARGVIVSPELEAIVRACLAKDPAERPQSALELRGKLESLVTEPWGSVQADTWWLEHRVALEEVDAASSMGGPRTIAVDGRARA